MRPDDAAAQIRNAPIVGPSDSAARFKLVRFKDVLLVTCSAYLVKGIIPRDGLIVIWGPPKCGKSFITLDLLMHIALGWPYRGLKVAQMPVVYVACEGERGLSSRVEAFRRSHAIADLDPPFYLVTTRLDLIKDFEALIVDIRAQIGDTAPGAIAIDTLNRSIRGSESDDLAMGNYVKACDALREAFNCAIIVIYHCGIDDTRPRGHTSLTGAVDAQLSVKRDEGGVIGMMIEHMKDGETGGIIASRLKPVKVGTDESGDEISSCIVVPCADQPKMRGAKLTPGERLFLQALENAIAEHGERRPNDRNYPPVALVSVETWKSFAIKGGATAGATSKESERALFSKAHKSLLAKEIVAEWEGMVWICATVRNQEQPEDLAAGDTRAQP